MGRQARADRATTARELRAALRATADPAQAAVLRRFFKTGPGEYGEGDRFLGVRVPAIRALARSAGRVTEADALALLRSPIHEERMLALVLLVRDYGRGDAAARERVFDLYLANLRHVDNWDLVDTSAPHIVGAHLAAGDRRRLERLARSEVLWERRIAILATHHFIRAGDPSTTLALARGLLGDRHDLMHKAVGWMLREVGNRCGRPILEEFLASHAHAMPRTMLRYAIERLPADSRARWMRARASHAAAPI